MKNFGKLLLTLLLCFSVVGWSNSKSTENITKELKEAGYTIKYNSDEYTTVTVSESSGGKEKSQYIGYVEDDAISSIAYIELPEDSENYEDMIIGFIYASEDSDSEVTDTVKEAAEKKLKKLDLTIDDLAKGDNLFFAATGITEGDLLSGVKHIGSNRAKTQSVVMRAKTGTIRFVDAIHSLDKNEILVDLMKKYNIE